MEDEAKLHEADLKKQLKVYNKLKKISNSEEFNEFFDLITQTAADKMMWAFMGDNIKTMEDWYKVKGEVTSYLFPLQEVRSAKSMSKHIKEQLDSYYNQTA